ncbi:MAG: DUF5683 domain-containing protein [Ferruginibacter sp.]
MSIRIKIILLSITCFLCCNKLFAQKKKDADTVAITTSGKVLSTKKITTLTDTTKKYNPNKAIIRSAILPGWGQLTNKKYWKAPIVWAGLGITVGVFFHNIKQYNESKQAYILATDNDPSNDYLIKQPYYSVKDQPERIRTFRNEVRQNVDYTVLFFLIFWGLNVADAAVDAHLKTFDVSDNLGFQIKPGYSPMANTNGVSLVLSFR